MYSSFIVDDHASAAELDKAKVSVFRCQLSARWWSRGGQFDRKM